MQTKNKTQYMYLGVEPLDHIFCGLYIYMYSIVFHYSHAYQANGWPLLNPFEIIGTSATRIRKWVSTYGQFDQAKSVAVWGTSHFWTNPIPYNIILLNIK
jgi:hypothetical protein